MVRVRVRTEGFFQTLRLWIAGAIIFAAFVALVYALRKSPYIADPYLDNYLQMAGGLLGFTFAANALVRFKGNHDRLSLILAFGFLLSGLIEAGASVSVYRDIGLSDLSATVCLGRLDVWPNAARRAADCRAVC